jgi:phosphoenolpyruvate carboxykinase (ATP)
MTFSPCFGAPFLPLHPTEYTNLLREKLFHHKARVWMVNTGWTGGPYGIGHRMSLQHTRAIITAILDGALNGVDTFEDPFFGLCIPKVVPDVPGEILDPRNTWGDKDAYDDKAADLTRRFKANFEQYADAVGADVVAAGPKA